MKSPAGTLLFPHTKQLDILPAFPTLVKNHTKKKAFKHHHLRVITQMIYTTSKRTHMHCEHFKRCNDGIFQKWFFFCCSQWFEQIAEKDRWILAKICRETKRCDGAQTKIYLLQISSILYEEMGTWEREWQDLWYKNKRKNITCSKMKSSCKVCKNVDHDLLPSKTVKPSTTMLCARTLYLCFGFKSKVFPARRNILTI